MWKWIIRAAVAAGLDKWAKRKAVEIAQKIRDRAAKKAVEVLGKSEAAAGAVEDASEPIETPGR